MHIKAKLISFTVLLFVCIVSVACGANNEPVVPEETTLAQKTDFAYLVTTDEAPEIKVSGSEFEVTTNNCGSRVSALESFSRSREFNIIFSAELSESIRGQLGGDIIVAGAEIETAVGVKLGIQVGSSESVKTERQIETPADSITTVRLRWEEIWQTGQVSITRSDGSVIGDVPFRVLTTLRLSQIGVQDIPCGTLIPTPSLESEPDITETARKPIATAPSSTVAPPVPTNTVASSPAPPPSATPSITNIPQPLVNEVHEVDAYRTALGPLYSSGIYIQSGDSVSIRYLNGQWWIGQGSSQGSNCNGFGDSQTPTDANGYLDREGERVEAMIGCPNPNICRPLTAAPWGSLLGAIGDQGALFHIGNQLDFVAQESGILYLRINYYNHNGITGCPYGDGGNITTRVNVTLP